MASAARPMAVRQCCRVKKSIAEINVPACATPTHHTKLMMSQPHATGCLLPQTPTPVEIRYISIAGSTTAAQNAAGMNNTHHQRGVLPSGMAVR